MPIPEVEIVLTNWKRKKNLPRIIAAMKMQSITSTITVIDNAVEDDEALDLETIDSVDKYFRIRNNPYGPFIRFACHGFYDADYVFAYDDDMIPGSECVAHFLKHAKSADEYGLLGQFGRVFREEAFHFNTLECAEGYTKVDLCICAYFFDHSIFPSISEIKRRVIRSGQERLFMQDDMLLAAACRLAGKEIGLPPKSSNKEAHVKISGLPSPFALSSTPGRPKVRQESLELIRSLICPGLF